jgi:uncharacterized RDD family membrane protein YckC
METPQHPEQPRPDQPAAPPPPPAGPQAPHPQAPGGPQAPPPQAPPGGWEQPIPQQPVGWHGTPLASWGSRVGATLIDWLILLVPVGILLAIVLGVAAGSDTGAIVTGILGFLTYLVVVFLYAPLLMARGGSRNGQTWGKQLLDIRVVRNGGQSMSFGYGALREIAVKGLALGIAGSIIPVIPYLLNYLWPLWDDENEALHDKIVSTHVVRA